MEEQRIKQNGLVRLLALGVLTVTLVVMVGFTQQSVWGLAASSIEQPGEYLTEAWKTTIWGTSIGASGLHAVDIDFDGVLEIVANSYEGYGGNQFWYIISYDPETGEFVQEWISPPYTTWTRRILVAEGDGGGQYLIYVALYDGSVEVYDAATREVVGTFTSSISMVEDMAVADVDGDAAQEIVISSSSDLIVHNAETFAVEWETSIYGGYDIEVGNVDGDAAPEIVSTGHVIDGVSHTLEWDYSNEGFTNIVQLADIDSDGMAEIIAAEYSYQINAFDADIHALKWNIPTDLDIDALTVTDFDNDNVKEVVYGDGQWGAIHVVDPTSKAEEWQINNPEHGVNRIAFGDVDGDAIVEVLWGTGWSSSGSGDYLFVGSTASHTVEWQSDDIEGPLSAVDVGDVDNDGTDEIVMASFRSEGVYDDAILFVYDAETFELEWQSDSIFNEIAYAGIHALELADVDNDGVLELLLGTADAPGGIILAYDGITHNLDWQTVKHDGVVFSALAVDDIDEDGQLEVIGGETGADSSASAVYVRVFDGSTGIEEWRTTDLGEWGGEWASVYDIDTGDFDQDGNPDILFSIDGGNAYVYDAITRAEKWQSSLTGARAVAGIDVDDDGDTEIVVGTNTGDLYAFNAQTFSIEWSESFSDQAINSLELADMNRDLIPELVLTDDGFLRVYDAITHELLWQSEYLGGSPGGGGHLVIDDINRDSRDEVVLGSNHALYSFAYSLLPFGSLVQVDKATAVPEDNLNYTVEVDNFSDDDLPAVITNTVPANTSLVAGSISVSDGEWNMLGEDIIWSVELATSETAFLTFTVTVDSAVADGTEITDTATTVAGQFTKSESATTIIDAQPPASTITNPTANEIVSGTTYTITGVASDSVSGVDKVEIRINGGAWQLVSGTTNWTHSWNLPVTDQEYVIETRASDMVGHVEADSQPLSVLVDNLSPQIVSVAPAHAAEDVAPDGPIEIEFSEPVLPDTLDFSCLPDVQDWSLSVSNDGTMITLNHADFEYEQMYTCHVRYVEDRAHHPLVESDIPNPWAFTTAGEESNVYLPLILRD